jgi:hypothetical protein
MFITLLVTLLSFGNSVFAQENLSTASKNLKNMTSRIGVGELPIDILVGNAVGAVLSFAGMIFFVFMVYAGYLWFTARGEDEQVKKATGIIKTSVVGIILLLSAGAITFFITERLQNGGAGSTPGTNTACTSKGWVCTEITGCISKHNSSLYSTLLGETSSFDSAKKINTFRSKGCLGAYCETGKCLADKSPATICCKP